MKWDKKVVAGLVLAFVVGYWWAGSRQPDPWTPHNDRPWLTWIAKGAKRLLWIAIVADPPPAELDEPAEARVGDDGYRLVQHQRGW